MSIDDRRNEQDEKCNRRDIMKIRGVQHDPLSDVANIRTTLKGYGTGFPIVKELIQNAEDAEASFIHLGWHPGFKDKGNLHPLLQVPALCMVNDGPFKDEHEQAICRLGLGTKAGDTQAIGRFGLGLKSVFHLCEAFFFMASDIVNGGKVRLAELFNPWLGVHHDEWQINDIVIQERLYAGIKDFVPSGPWFALWLPLRTRTLCKNVAPIINEWPGETDEPAAAIKDLFRDELGDVLSLLKHLMEIRYSVWHNGGWKLNYSLKVDALSIRRRFPEEVNSEWHPNGLIRAKFQGSNDVRTFFSGVEAWLQDTFLVSLKESQNWPKVVAITENGADPGRAEKALPHYGVFLTQRSSSHVGKLRIKWAVFLPIGNDPYDEITLSTIRSDITIILHGYFFLNSDRTNIDGLEHDFQKDGGIYRQWNTRLALNGTIGEVLPAVDRFVYHCRLGHEDIVDLTRSLLHSKLFAKFRNYLCRNYQWVFLLDSNGGSWKCIEANETIYGLPIPADRETALPFSVFPNLTSVSEKYRISFNDEMLQAFPFISSRGIQQFPLQVLIEIFQNINPSCVDASDTVKYLLQVLDANDQHLNDPQLIGMIQHLPLFNGRSLRNNIRKRYSLYELEERQRKFSAFYSGIDGQIVKHLQEACDELDLVFLSDGISEDIHLQRKILCSLDIPEVSPDSVANTLLNATIAGPVENRRRLLRYLLSGLTDLPMHFRRRKAIRYLLHGDPQFSNSDGTLYMASADEKGETWNRLVRAVLASGGETWKIISNEYENEFSPQLYGACGMQKISVSSACELLRASDLKKVNFSLLDSSDQRHILLDIEDDDLLRKLPIHHRVGGGLVDLNDYCYLQSEFGFEGALAQQWEDLLRTAIVIRRSDDTVLLAKQKSLIPELDANAAIKLALSSEKPPYYAPTILAGLHRVGTPRQEMRILVQETPWLPLQNGGVTAPKDIIHIEGAQEEIHRLLHQESEGLSGILAVERWILEHPGLSSLKQLFPRANIALEYLGLWLSEKEDMKIGLENLESSDDLGDFVKIFHDTSHELMPCYRLLKDLTHSSLQNAHQLTFDYLLPHLCGPMTDIRIRTVLNYLSEHHEQFTDNTQKRLYRKWFELYLDASVREGSIGNIIGALRFLNQVGRWIPSSRLTVKSEGISARDQIDDSQMDILSPFIYAKRNEEESSIRVTAEEAETLPGVEESIRVLQKYFSSLEQLVPREMIGAVIALLGDFPDLRDWAEKLLEHGKYSIETIRRELFMDCTSDPNVYLSDLAKMHFIAQVISGGSAQVRSLSGNFFSASVSESPTSLLFGDGHDMWWSLEVPGYNSLFCHKICLLQINELSSMSQADIEKLLQKTAELIVYHAHINRRCYPNFDSLWEKLRATGQRSIVTSQLYLLNSGDFYVRQLGGDHNRKLKDNLRKWDKAKNLEAESEAFARQKAATYESSRGIRQEARDELKKLLTEDEDVHEFMVNAVKDKLRSYQYDISSIPFELFQNADDAYQEALTLGTPAFIEAPLFSIDIDNTSIVFCHWGRLINEYHSVSLPDIGKKLGFDRDLEKMLTLSFSEKNIEDNELIQDTRNVTGKFGLGFKCVFFATSTPRVLSCRLNFHIRGGFYPERLDITHEERLRGLLSSRQNSLHSIGTAIELPLLEQPANIIIDRFKDLIGILLSFSRQIKTCIIKEQQNEALVKWDEEVVAGTMSCFVGSVNNRTSNIFLVLRPSEGSDNIRQSAILFQLSSRGFERTDDSIPSVWITAPTQEKTNSGYVVNGPFDPDVGRSRLALNSPNNLLIAQDLAVVAGNMFTELYQAVETNWPEVVKTLRLSIDMSPDAFWSSFWELMISDTFLATQKQQVGSASNILYSIMWGADSGYYGFIKSCDVLPSGLNGTYKRMLSLKDVCYRSSGLLDIDQIFDHVARWESFQNNIHPGSIISEKNIFHPLCRAVGSHELSNCQKVTLVNVIESEMNGSYDVVPSSAARIGLLVNRDFQKRLQEGELTNATERQNFLELMGKLRFKTKGGIYRLAKEQIISESLSDQVDRDEVLRAQFAPGDFLLSSEYKEAAIELFIICREKMFAPADMLAQWARDAHQRNQLLDVFRYLLEGDLRFELAKKLESSWLRSVLDSDDFEALLLGEQNELKWLLRIELSPDPVPNPPVIPNIPTMEQIYKWWEDNKTSYLDQYEASIFPDQRALKLSYHDVFKIEDDIEIRKKWITLFMLGSFHTMGRTIPGQHKNFINLCSEKKWLDRFADPTASPDSLLSILDEYLADPFARSSYYHWMKQFISFYQISKWLPTYVYSIVEIAKIKEPFSLDTIFNIRRNSGMTGSGLDAPPLDRGLGIGTCFVVRELLRCGFFDNVFAYEHAFVPRRAVRSVLARLGATFADAQSEPVMSKEIFRFLCDNLGNDRAHFHKSFDIPFAVLAKNPDLLYEITDIEPLLLDESPVEYLDDD